MPQEERFNKRDLTYSAWHRRMSLRRYIGIEAAQTCAMIDTDARCWVEYEDRTYRPLMLIEEARDVGQGRKTATVTRNEARRGARCGEDIPAFVVLYTPSDKPNPANRDWPDIQQFRVRQIWPQDTDWAVLTPKQWADRIITWRRWSADRLDQAMEAAE